MQQSCPYVSQWCQSHNSSSSDSFPVSSLSTTTASNFMYDLLLALFESVSHKSIFMFLTAFKCPAEALGCVVWLCSLKVYIGLRIGNYLSYSFSHAG
jgi:hypothetical protein